MPELIYLTILTALFVNGLQIATGENMILNFVKVWLDKVFFIREEIDLENKTDTLRTKKVFSKWYYPILYCHKCMPSVYGTAMCFMFLPVTWHMAYEIPIVIFCSCALSDVVHVIIE